MNFFKWIFTYLKKEKKYIPKIQNKEPQNYNINIKEVKINKINLKN